MSRLIELATEFGNTQRNWRGETEYVFSLHGLEELAASIEANAQKSVEVHMCASTSGIAFGPKDECAYCKPSAQLTDEPNPYEHSWGLIHDAVRKHYPQFSDRHVGVLLVLSILKAAAQRGGAQ